MWCCQEPEAQWRRGTVSLPSIHLMDETVKPLRIPPQMSVYADKHGVFQLVQVKKKIKINIGCRRVESGRMATSVCVFQSMVSSLIVDQPGDPVLHLISFLQRSNQSSKSWTATRWSCDSTHSPSIIGSQSGATFSQSLSHVFASGRQSNYGKWKQAKQKERQVRNS